MERLTARTPNGDAYYPKCFERCKGYQDLNQCETCPLDIEIAEKLAAYEDLDEREQEKKVILHKALDTYGEAWQIKKLFEEIGEMQEALCKCTDGRDTVEHLAEEIADVRIMLTQMCILHDCENLADEIMIEKLLRLDDRVEKARGRG